jgi:ABC-type multidrug transport system fused ATPase/permease subunit
MSRISTGDSPFRQQLLAALEHFGDLEWLGESSPLATPYFLGEHLSRQPYVSTTFGRGQALRKLIRETALTLAQQDREGEYYYHLLALSFFRSQSILHICQELNTSRATYYRHRTKAIASLEQALIQRLKPALRLEEPPTSKQEMVGRQDAFSRCLQTIRRKQTVAITGHGGVGKTTLGARLALSLKPQPG